MPAEVRVYQPGSSDFAAAWQLRRAVLLDPFHIDHDEARADDALALHFGIFSGDTCNACLLLVPRSSAVVQMRQVAVASHLARRGLGRKLVTHAEEAARERGFQHMVAHARRAAVPFYFALGYVTRGEAFEEVGIPHLRVEKSLLGETGAQ